MPSEPQPLTKQDLLDALEAQNARFDARIEAQDARFDALLEAQTARFDARIDAAVRNLLARQEAFVDAFTHNLSELRNELVQRLERLENKVERTDSNISGIMLQITGMNKSLSVLERDQDQTIATQKAQ